MKHHPTWFVFCDESGNTGSNFLDVGQPWYALAGLAVEHSALERVRDAVRGSLLKAPAGTLELKGKALVGRPAGRALAHELHNSVGAAGCVPFLVLVEKRYGLATRYVDLACDPTINPQVSAEWWGDADSRRSAGDRIALIPGNALLAIQGSLRDPWNTNWQLTTRSVVDALRTGGSQELAEMIEGAQHATADDLLGAEIRQDFDPREFSVNDAAFTSMLQLVDHDASLAGITAIRFVHDETSSFERVFKRSHERLTAKASGGEPVFDADGNKVWPLLAVQDVAFESSHNEPLIQTADVHAAMAAWVASAKAEASLASEPAVRGMAEWMMAMLFSQDPRLMIAIVSDAGLRELAARLTRLREGTAAE